MGKLSSFFMIILGSWNFGPNYTLNDMYHNKRITKRRKNHKSCRIHKNNTIFLFCEIIVMILSHKAAAPRMLQLISLHRYFEDG